MNFKAISFFRRPAAAKVAIPSTTSAPLARLPAHKLEDMYQAKRAEIHAINDARHIALARESRLKAYRIDIRYAVGTESGCQIFWNTSSSPAAILNDMKAFVIAKQQFHGSRHFAGEAIFTDLLTGQTDTRRAQVLLAA